MESFAVSVLLVSAVSNLFTAYVAYMIAKREKIVEIKLPKPRKKVVVIKGSPTYGEAFLEDIKNN